MAEQTSILTNNPQRYLTWSTKSIKNLVNLYLSESGVYSDQLFEGSNLSILNNLFAFTYDASVFYLNNAASEAMFADAQYYEDMNRIVKLLNYKPRGFTTSIVELAITPPASTLSTDTFVFPRYSAFSVSTSNGTGQSFSATYSLVDDFSFSVTNGTTVVDDRTMVLHNGTWQLYDSVLNAVGVPFETFTMSNLSLADSQHPVYLAHPFVDAYVEDPKTGAIERWSRVLDLYDSGSSDKHYDVRVDEGKQYTVRFGDGVTGQKLKLGAKVYLLWLRSDGPDGAIGVRAIDTANPSKAGSFSSLGIRVVGLDPQYVSTTLIGGDATYSDPSPYGFANPEASTPISDFETVEEMRQAAPNFFRMQGRLVTAQDYEQFVLASHVGNKEILDVRVQSNSDYMRDFQQWLYSYGRLSPEIAYYSYRYADSCDFNSVYVWLKSSSKSGAPVSFSTKDAVLNDVSKLKTLTTEAVLLDPILVAFTPFCPTATAPTWSQISATGYFDNDRIVLVRDRNSLVSVESIRRKAYSTVSDFFLVTNNRLGGTVDLGVLLGKLLTIAGVKEVRTVRFSADGVTPTSVFSGLSFGVWTPLILRGADFVTSNGAVGLRAFQFPFLFEQSKILNRIVVQSENFKLNNVAY